MCVIVYKPKKANVTKKILRQCWDENPDSGGFMFANNGGLVIHKGFTSFKPFYKDFRKHEQLYNENFVLHFRIATHGRIDKANCHPFVVNKNIGFAHNGIINCVKATKEKSDTSIFCEQVLQKLPSNFLNRPEYRILLDAVCKAESSKFVFLTNKGIGHIFNEVAGTWTGGCWFSNTNFARDSKPMENKWYKKYSLVHIMGDDYAECVWCGDYFLKDEHLSCCNTCREELEQDKYSRPYG